MKLMSKFGYPNKNAGLMLLPSEDTRKMHMKSLIFTALPPELY